jgi:copper chaperone CopZ
MKKRNQLAVLFAMLFAGLLVLGASVQPVLAAERVIEFSIPGCEWPATADRVSYILKKVDGIIKVVPDAQLHIATITYDDTKTNPDIIAKKLRKGGYPPDSPPKFIK